MTVRSAAIGEIAVVNPRQPTRSSDDCASVPFIPMAAVSENGGILTEVRRPLSDLKSGYTYFERGDIILAKITPCFENGKVAHLDSLSHPFGFGSTEFHVLRAGPGLDPRYLYHAVRSPQFRQAGASRMTGSAGQQRVPSAFVATYRIPVPPFAEQCKIAAMLDKADRIQGRRRDGLRLLQNLRQSVFLQIFGDPARNEKDGETIHMGDVISETQYGTSAPANTQRNGLPVLRMNNITPSGAIDLRDIKWCPIESGDLEKYTVRCGDLLFNRTNSPELVGKTAVWDRDERYAFAGYLIRVRFNQKRVLPEYVSGFLNSPYGKRLLFAKAKPSINMSNISPTELKRLSIPVPSLAIQWHYVEVLAKVKVVEQRMTGMTSPVHSLYHSLAHQALGVT